MSNALDLYEKRLSEKKAAVEEDLLFHLKIAEASKNTVLKSLMMIITPDIINSFIQFQVCDDAKDNKTIKEHRNILEMISNQDEKGAVKAMELHLSDIADFSLKFKP